MTDTQKKVGAIVLAVAAGGFLVYMIARNVVEPEPPANTRVLMDAETGQLVKVPTIELGAMPMANPKTGKKTLYPTETCFWGEECRKKGGTRVIMNDLLGKPGPTKCPVCGHAVYFHNPRPPEPEESEPNP